MFLFSIISFQHDAKMDTIRTLIGFAILQGLKTIVPPNWPVYTHFRHHQALRIDNILPLINSCLFPYVAEDCLPDAEFGLSSKLRKKNMKAEQAHKTQQEKDAKTLAEFLLGQWPCPEPTIEGFEVSILVDVQQALEYIRPEWLRLFQNLELSNYISQAQQVLNQHR